MLANINQLLPCDMCFIYLICSAMLFGHWLSKSQITYCLYDVPSLGQFVIATKYRLTHSLCFQTGRLAIAVLEAFLNHLIFWTVAHFKLLARLVDPVLPCQSHSPAEKQEAQEADSLSGELQSHLPFSTTVLGGKGPRERGQILSLDSWSSLVIQLWCLQLTHRNPGSLEFLGEEVSVVH